MSSPPRSPTAPVLENADREILIEEVLQLQPDLCLTMTQSTADYLAENGQTVIFLSWSEVEDVKVAVELMGEVLGTHDIADDYIQYFDDTVARAGRAHRRLTDGEKVKVLYGQRGRFEPAPPHRRVVDLRRRRRLRHRRRPYPTNPTPIPPRICWAGTPTCSCSPPTSVRS